MYLDDPTDLDIDALHDALFGGAIARFTDLAAMRDLVDFTQEFVVDQLSPHTPIEIHRHLDRDELAETLAGVRHRFTNLAETKKLWRAVFEAAGLDPDDTMRDRLVLRFQPPVPPSGEPHRALSTGTVGFHRDTWGTNLYAQINWWAPVYPITEGRTFAFAPAFFAKPIANNSAGFDIAKVIDYNRKASSSANRPEMVPRPLEALDANELKPVVIAPGEVIVFSSQHAHVGVPNHTDRTRISLETRTLRLSDFHAGHGAANVDGRARWIVLGFFRRVSDGERLTDILGMESLVPFTGPMPPESQESAKALR